MRHTTFERYLPVAYLLVAVTLIVALLPTTLRPPQPPPPTSAEFSPDAPPDEDHEVILSELSRGTTTTAGAGETVETGSGAGAPAPIPEVEVAPRRGRCFGDPPRQAHSLYSAPCVPAWQGDNGGATSFGVTENEVRVAVYIPNTDTSTPEGPVDDATTGESDTKRIYRVYQEYFNQHYEFYGRRMRIFLVKGDLTQAAQGVAAAQSAKQVYRVFAGADTFVTNQGLINESTRLEIVTWTAYQATQFYASRAPYAWSPLMANERAVAISNELVCKQLAGKPPSLNNESDPTFNYNAPRRFGLILYEDSTRVGMREQIDRELGRCDARPTTTVVYNLNEGVGALSGAMTRMRADGVTTVLVAGDWFTPQLYTNEADTHGYYPEYVQYGVGGTDQNGLIRDVNQDQWQHAVGISMLEIARNRVFQAHYQAYEEMDPNNDPGGQSLGFAHLTHIANGIQMAGPELTPDAFMQGLQSMPNRAPDPIWSVGGGFSPPDPFTYSKYAGLLWWDRDASAPGNPPGAYRWMLDGKRFSEGQIPTEPLPFQEEGIVTPEDPTTPM